VLPPFHFGESIGDMGPLRIQLAGSLKCSDGVGKLPLRQVHVPARKGIKR
jgi:hypothetical protein